MASTKPRYVVRCKTGELTPGRFTTYQRALARMTYLENLFSVQIWEVIQLESGTNQPNT
jgi:hypothetical protein